MSDSIGPDATPHPRDGSSHLDHNNDSSDSDNVSTPPFLSRPHSRQSNRFPEAANVTLATTTTATEAGESATATTSAPKPRTGFRPSVFGHHRKSSSKSKKATAPDSEDSHSDSSADDEKGGRGGSSGKKGRRRRFSDSASHLLAQAPPVPDLRFDNNYRKALNQIYETHAQETTRATAALTGSTSTTIDSDEKKAAGSLQQQQQNTITSSKQVRRVPSIAARVTVMTVRDIIIMPFIHGFFWGFGTILLTLAGQRSLVYHVQRTWRQAFGGNPDDVTNLPRGQPARIRRAGGGGGGGLGLMNAGTASPGFGRAPGHVY
ncbi:hypothetical protein BGX29_003941 [Mortierella sp. GBA35]|nr:hypothetical protein BGX23_004394 [Mortierella sp. AD031]KAF9103003.1 hypothetical protein BGX29_003941 [Mortierella sp. GBA35]KAG0207543.1 hypothetical protein BGX33_006786 [Mortierella sp. NVP41]